MITQSDSEAGSNRQHQYHLGSNSEATKGGRMALYASER
jgi:hypothetical protein